MSPAKINLFGIVHVQVGFILPRKCMSSRVQEGLSELRVFYNVTVSFVELHFNYANILLQPRIVQIFAESRFALQLYFSVFKPKPTPTIEDAIPVRWYILGMALISSPRCHHIVPIYSTENYHLVFIIFLDDFIYRFTEGVLSLELIYRIQNSRNKPIIIFSFTDLTLENFID